MHCLISQADNKMFHNIQAVGIKCIIPHMQDKLQFGHIFYATMELESLQ
jgi:hypothetical protein